MLPMRWRAIHATELSGFPCLLYQGEYLKVVSKGWNQKKNTMYDIFIHCMLRFNSAPPQTTFDSANHMIFSIPYTADIYQNAKIFWYNTQDEDPHGLKDHLLTKPMQGMPKRPRMETPLVEKVHLSTRGSFPNKDL